VGHDLLEEAKLAKALVQELVDNSGDEESVGETAEALKSHIEILWSFIQILEEFGRADNREIAPLQADKIVTTFFRRYKPLLNRSESGIVLQLGTGAADAKIRMARRDLESILINLTTNAVQALEESGASRIVRVSTASDKQQWRLNFSDNAGGVHPSIKDDLFERGVTTREKTGGSGLGLSIVRSAIEDAGGTIVLASESELSGATFEVAIPIMKGK
jgi:C4-dicarboxylate-specific signal transduction histidine kinase